MEVEFCGWNGYTAQTQNWQMCKSPNLTEISQIKFYQANIDSVTVSHQKHIAQVSAGIKPPSITALNSFV